MFRSASPSTFCAKSRSPLLARASPLTPVVLEKQLDPAILVVPFSSVAVRSQEVSKVSKEPEMQRLRYQWLDHVLLRAIPFLMSDVQEVSHSHLHLHACLEHEPDMLVFAHGKGYMPLWVTKSITRFSRRLIRETRPVQQKCPIVEYSAGEENKPKLDM